MTLGRVHYVTDEYIPFRTMIRGSYFGEIEILLKQRRSHSVFAGENCDTLTLSRQIYENVIAKEYPEVDSELKKVAALRIQKNQDSEKQITGKRTDNNVEVNNLNETKKINPRKNSIKDRRLSKVANTINTSNISNSNSQKNQVGNNTSGPSQNNANINIINNTFNTNIFNLNNQKRPSFKTDKSNNKSLSVSKSKREEVVEDKKKNAESLSSSDNSSDYLSPSEQDKIINKIEKAKDFMKGEQETINIKADNDINLLKEEMVRYSIQQKEILNNINTLLKRLDKK